MWNGKEQKNFVIGQPLENMLSLMTSKQED